MYPPLPCMQTEVKGNALQDLSSHLQALTEAVVSMTMEMTAVDDKVHSILNQPPWKCVTCLPSN